MPPSSHYHKPVTRAKVRRGAPSKQYLFVFLSRSEMEFLDEEARPRFLVQSRISSSSSSLHKPHKIDKINLAICGSVSIILAALAIFVFESQTLQLIFIWISLSLLIGPLAPSSLTGGSIRVGQGEILEFQDQDLSEVEEPEKRKPNRRSKVKNPEESRLDPPPAVPRVNTTNLEESEKKIEKPVSNGALIQEEKEWNQEDYEILKKQILKHPVGEPRRWELISEAFRGRHGLDSVIKMGKSMSERKIGDQDSYAQFLKQRKPLDRRAEGSNEEVSVVPIENDDFVKENGSSWSSGEDLALLSALKAFPKDVAMRWEKIAMAVPGKSKACCMKRVAELKKGFRTSKGSKT